MSAPTFQPENEAREVPEGFRPGQGGLYTAAQIAVWLSKSPQSVRKALLGIEAAAVRIVAGIETAAWRFDQLPQGMQDRLNEEAGRRRYRNAEAMLSTPAQLWNPPIPLNQIAQEDIDQAVKLRTALQPWVSQQHSLQLSSSEIERCGVADYAKAFGHRITGRYWRELFARTLRRDGGAENWNRLEIYLLEKPTSKVTPGRLVSDALAREFAELDGYISACSDPTNPSNIEQRGIWTLALGEFSALVRNQVPRKQAARRVRSYLFAKAPFLASTRDALLKAFTRKLDDLEKAGGDPKALRDGREENGERFELSEDDRDLLIHRAVFYYRGDVAPAWRDCLANGFSALVRERYTVTKPQRKAHVPTSVMESVAPEVAIMTVMHQGKRAFDSIKGHVDRNYDGIASLRCMSADDFTMPVYYYVPDGKGWFNLTRGQILIFIDFRSLCILGWSMQPDRNYSSLTIRSLCTHVFGEFGLPEVLYFERGIWQSSSLLKGREPAPFQFTEVVHGLTEFGILFKHAIRPRTKVVERVGGLLQDLMEAEPGYCGREERKDAPEKLRKDLATVEARNAHPAEFFYSYDEWEHRFGELVEKYNATPQQGRILQNMSPGEALAKYADHDNPPMQLGAAVRHLLANDKRTAVVTLNGVKVTVGKTTFKYRGTQISHLVGHEVIVWFDPENPEYVTVTDMNRDNPICVERAGEPSALECLVDPNSGNLGRELKRIEDQASYMKARFRAVKSKFPLPQRQLLADAQTLHLGQQFEQQRGQRELERTEKNTRTRTTQDRARKLGLPTGILHDGPESARGTASMLAAERAYEQKRVNNPATEEAL